MVITTWGAEVELYEKFLFQEGVSKWKWVVKFCKICNCPSPFCYFSESKGPRQNLSDQLRGFWSLSGKQVQINLLNVVNVGPLRNTFILLVDTINENF